MSPIREIMADNMAYFRRILVSSSGGISPEPSGLHFVGSTDILTHVNNSDYFVFLMY